MRASPLRWLLPAMVLVAVVLVPLAAWGQTPLPGEQPEVARPWTWWLSIPIALGAIGLALLIAFSYIRLSPRFYGREEPPAPQPPPRAYAGVNAPAYPAPVARQAAAPQAPPARAATATAERPAPTKPSPEQPAAEPAAEEEAAAETEAAPTPEPAREAQAQQPQAEATQAESGQPDTATAERPQGAPETREEPAEAGEERAEPAQEPAEASGPDEDVYERVRQEQLDKGVSPKVAEGRAKAAALKASRQRSG